MSRKSRDLFCIFAMTRQIQKISLLYFRLHKADITTSTKNKNYFLKRGFIRCQCLMPKSWASSSSDEEGLLLPIVNPVWHTRVPTNHRGERRRALYSAKDQLDLNLIFCRPLSLTAIEDYIIMFWQIRKSHQLWTLN